MTAFHTPDSQIPSLSPSSSVTLLGCSFSYRPLVFSHSLVQDSCPWLLLFLRRQRASLDPSFLAPNSYPQQTRASPGPPRECCVCFVFLLSYYPHLCPETRPISRAASLSWLCLLHLGCWFMLQLSPFLPLAHRLRSLVVLKPFPSCPMLELYGADPLPKLVPPVGKWRRWEAGSERKMWMWVWMACAQ